MNEKKIADLLDRFYNEHMVNGATLFGVFLALYGVSQIPPFVGNRVFYYAMWFFIVITVYEILVKGIVVRILRKKSKYL